MRIDYSLKRCTVSCSLAIVLAMGVQSLAAESADTKSTGASPSPYRAVVLENETDVKAGPQADFYATNRLEQGDQVEVYRADQDGWLAIRPPKNAFSWVAAEHVELTESGTRARVINTPTKTRVGSRFSDVHDVEYISLDKGEVLELLGTKLLKDAETGAEKRWFKIAPPSGEFRWIHQDMVARLDKHAGSPNEIAETIETFALPGQDEQGDSAKGTTVTALNLEQPVADSIPTTEIQQAAIAAADTQSIPTQAIPANEFRAASGGANSGGTGTETVARTSNQTGWASKQPSARMRSQPIAQVNHMVPAELASSNRTTTASHASIATSPLSNAEQRLNAKQKSAKSLATTQLTHVGSSSSPQTTTHINAVTWEAVTDPTNPLAAPEPRSFEDAYQALNILLSRSVLGDMKDWRLGQITHQAKLLKQSARTRDHLELADQLKAKIAEFQSLQQRKLREIESEKVAVATSQTQQTSVALASYTAEDLAKKSEIVGSGRRVPKGEPRRLPASILQTSGTLEDATPSVLPQVPQAPAMPRRVKSARTTSAVHGAPKLQPAAALDNSIFDATGTLIKVHSRRNGMPRYALTDNSGQITRFVSTGDGSSLDHFVNSRVGLLGEVGLLSGLNKSHVIAFKAVKLAR